MKGEGGARDTRRKDSLFCLYLFSTFFPSPRGGRPYSSPSPPPSPHPSSSPPRSFLFPLFLVSPSRSFFLALLPFFPSLSARRARTPRPFLFHPRLKMWHSTGLLRCLRWCGIRAGLPRRGVHRGNDAQIGRIISKTTTLRLQPSSYYRSSPLISLSLSLSLPPCLSTSLAPSLAPCRRLSLSFSRPYTLDSSTAARDGIQPPLSPLPPNNHPATAACHGARRRVTESSDYYLICWHEHHATLPSPARIPVIDPRFRGSARRANPRKPATCRLVYR